MNINLGSTTPGVHWDTFYRSAPIPTVPSQFATFMASEEPDASIVVDFGCGNGRDTLFFARHGKRSIGIDASISAIESCRASAQQQSLPAYFINADIAEQDCARLALDAMRGTEGKVLVYARFFLHAIPLEAEMFLLRHAANILRERDGVFALEFRTNRDSHQTKVTPDHYRRFVDPIDFIARAAGLGFAKRYYVDGFGLAKYKDDDAHIARCVLSTS